MKESLHSTSDASRSVAHQLNKDEKNGCNTCAQQKSVAQMMFLKQSGKIQTWNLAARHLVGNTTLGYTPPTINSTVVHGYVNAGAVTAAIKLPTINTVAIENGHEATVTDVARNNLGYDMYLPMPPPWAEEGTKMDVAGVTGLHRRANNLDGNATLEVTGRNSSPELRAQIERHETVHSTDIVLANDQIFGAWDRNLEHAKTTGRKFRGNTAAEAIDAAYQYAGGTPDQIGTQLHTRWGNDSDAYHQTAGGKTILDPSRHNNDFSVMKTVYFLTS